MVASLLRSNMERAAEPAAPTGCVSAQCARGGRHAARTAARRRSSEPAALLLLFFGGRLGSRSQGPEARRVRGSGTRQPSTAHSGQSHALRVQPARAPATLREAVPAEATRRRQTRRLAPRSLTQAHRAPRLRTLLTSVEFEYIFIAVLMVRSPQPALRSAALPPFCARAAVSFFAHVTRRTPIRKPFRLAHVIRRTPIRKMRAA